MDGRAAALCFTSPPYANQRAYTTGGIDDWDALMHGVFANLPMQKRGQVLVNLGLVHSEGEWLNYWDVWIESMRAMGWRRFAGTCGIRAGMPGDWGRFAPAHEFVFHFNRESRSPTKFIKCVHAGEPSGGAMRQANGVMGAGSSGQPIQPFKIPDSVIAVERAHGNQTGHPAVFPVGLPAFLMRAWTDAGELCYEPFAGSGTQFVAAEQLNRVCYGLEIAPEYCAVILERMSEMGLQPELCR